MPSPISSVPGVSPSTKCLLHIFLLTYNREKSLRRTLDAIAASPLKAHPLVVMDNCSTDGTPAVCEEFRAILPRMEVRRHSRNIGFGANFLRSVESSEGEYTWILADDDTLFPERVDALLELLRTARPEACFVGGPRQEAWPSGVNVSPREIQRRFRTFLTGQSFVPSVVFRQSLIGTEELVAGYFGIATNFPQLIIGTKLLLNDIPCAVLHPPVLQRDDPEERWTQPLNTIDGWSSFSRSLPRALRRDAFYSIFARPDMLGMVKETMRMVIWAKIDRAGEPAHHLASIGLNVGLAARVALIPVRLACMVPGGVYNLARETYRMVKYGWMRKPLPPNYHVPAVKDQLRR